jgi:hypothetical protein
MPDDLKKRGPQDGDRINVNEPWEVRFWCDQLQVDPDRLKAAVQKVGPMVTDVRRALQPA